MLVSPVSDFNGTFAPKIAAMEASARLYGIGGKLRYVTGSYLGITRPSSKCPAAPNTTYTVISPQSLDLKCKMQSKRGIYP